ncbi:MAG: ElyC/SanA/YdcF family protein, partial [Pseudomonadota bacterium]
GLDHMWCSPEAHIFNERALSNGIHKTQVLVEPEATNFGENITFSKSLIPEARTAIFVSKPNSLLRVKLTVEAQWPNIEAYVSCPDLEFPDEVSNVVGVLGVISEMVGDIERIQRYPTLGYQAQHTLPEEIINSWHYLVEQGFTEHLMSE